MCPTVAGPVHQMTKCKQNRLFAYTRFSDFCLRNDFFRFRVTFLPPEGKHGLKSRLRWLSASYDSNFTIWEYIFDNLTLQNRVVGAVFAHFFGVEFRYRTPRRAPQHDTTFSPTRRELIDASSRSFGKIDAKKLLFRRFPECAIIDVLTGKRPLLLTFRQRQPPRSRGRSGPAVVPRGAWPCISS